MITTSDFLGFATVSLAVAVAPGPSWVYVISSTIAGSRRAGFAAVAGNGTGILVHAAAAAAGLSAVLTWSTAAFTIARFVGALYLVYLAIRTVRQTLVLPSARGDGRSMRRVYRDGLLVNLFNPKVPLLMLALLPQFLAPESGRVPLQIVLFGGTHVLIASLVLTTIVLTAWRASATIHDNPRVERAFRWLSGTILFGFGVRLLVDRSL